MSFMPLGQEAPDISFWQDGAIAFRDTGLAMSVGAYALLTELSGTHAEPLLTAATAVGVLLAGAGEIARKTLQGHSVA